jgi:L-seryl-tRNA(Ser) seleniumtransferase
MRLNVVADLLRQIPKVDDLLRHDDWRRMLGSLPASLSKDMLRITLDELRASIKDGRVVAVPASEQIIADTAKKVQDSVRPGLRVVINATGVIIHTNLGRAMLSQAATDAVLRVASNYCNLEYDVAAGQRGDRYEHCLSVLRKLTGAQGALIVNNNAAAVLLILNTLSEGREVVISRGELIEIGGSFRLPDVMKKSGGLLREGGTTNRTFTEDYETAPSPQTGLIMKAHTRNYRIRGFMHETDTVALVTLGKKQNVPVYFDAGSGLLFPLTDRAAAPGAGQDEPCIVQEMEKGIDIISFSGDKLLGGPQAGIILGKREYIDKLKKNSLTRVIRPDKFTLAALESTLVAYFNRDTLKEEIPIFRMIHADPKVLKKRAGRLAAKLRQSIPAARLSVVELASETGGGTMPDVHLPSFGLALETPHRTAEQLESGLRMLEVPIIARIEKERVLFDLRTVRESEEKALAAGIETVVKHGA